MSDSRSLTLNFTTQLSWRGRGKQTQKINSFSWTYSTLLTEQWVLQVHFTNFIVVVVKLLPPSPQLSASLGGEADPTQPWVTAWQIKIPRSLPYCGFTGRMCLVLRWPAAFLSDGRQPSSVLLSQPFSVSKSFSNVYLLVLQGTLNYQSVAESE